MQRYLNTTHRSAVWFKKTFDAGDLVIKPPFQRNPVWSLRQKSSLIDTILLEYPIPELYMQEVTDADGNQKHILVDGQQRIRAVLAFVAGEFDLEEESPNWAGLGFEDLSQQDRKKLFEYNFVVRLLPDMPDEEVRAIFQRVNKNTTTLNAQELRHATYWGPFIKLMEEVSDYDFWSTAGLFSANDRRRMLDVEFISEIAVAALAGLQNKKRRLEEFYQQFETSFEDEEKLRTIFVRVLGEIDQLFPDFAKTRWRKKSDFYTLFVKLAKHSAQLPLSADKRGQAAAYLRNLANDVDKLISDGPSQLGLVEREGWTAEDEQSNKRAHEYLANVERAASDLGARRERERLLDELLAPVFT
ncbi:MAG TPA: DUF262 domain-containing protein [Bryobacteraceae bacterium]|nr:DUF262 domain-containing protein [Bryobacteraceae bacterium]